MLIQARKLSKNYYIGEIENMALENISFSVEAGAFAAIVGPSGSGKSTLLNLVGALDHPSSGELQVCATQISTLSRTEAAKFRGDNIGFIFQDFNLIPVLTVFENVEYPLLMVRNWPAEKRRERVMQVLAAVGMVEQAEKKPDQISGGQKQRVAVARALVGEPKLVLADEPTANLDHDTAYRIINLMKQMRDDFGTTFLFSTHDPKIMLEAEQTFVLEDGHLSVTGGAL
jgi:putative ABC transport system ATP-binding protein